MNVDEWKAKNPGKDGGGLTDRDGTLYMQRGEIDIMVVERQSSGKAKVIAREEIKTGVGDTHARALGQLDDQSGLLRDGAAVLRTSIVSARGPSRERVGNRARNHRKGIHRKLGVDLPGRLACADG